MIQKAALWFLYEHPQPTQQQLHVPKSIAINSYTDLSTQPLVCYYDMINVYDIWYMMIYDIWYDTIRFIVHMGKHVLDPQDIAFIPTLWAPY